MLKLSNSALNLKSKPHSQWKNLRPRSVELPLAKLTKTGLHQRRWKLQRTRARWSATTPSHQNSSRRQPLSQEWQLMSKAIAWVSCPALEDPQSRSLPQTTKRSQALLTLQLLKRVKRRRRRRPRLKSTKKKMRIISQSQPTNRCARTSSEWTPKWIISLASEEQLSLARLWLRSLTLSQLSRDGHRRRRSKTSRTVTRSTCTVA